VTTAALERWQAFNGKLRRYRRMYVMDGSFAEICAAVVGFDAARSEEDVLPAFQDWLALRHPRIGNLAFWSIVVAEAFPENPRGDPRRLNDEQQEQAIATLHDLLSRFLADCAAIEGQPRSD
jgi:hypothetical protein